MIITFTVFCLPDDHLLWRGCLRGACLLPGVQIMIAKDFQWFWSHFHFRSPDYKWKDFSDDFDLIFISGVELREHDWQECQEHGGASVQLEQRCCPSDFWSAAGGGGRQSPIIYNFILWEEARSLIAVFITVTLIVLTSCSLSSMASITFFSARVLWSWRTKRLAEVRLQQGLLSPHFHVYQVSCKYSNTVFTTRFALSLFLLSIFMQILFSVGFVFNSLLLS